MSLTDLLKAAQQRQQELQAIEDQKAEAKEQERQKELAIEKEEFETQLKMYAGDIFDYLDDVPQIESLRHGCTVLRVNVFHRTLLLRMLPTGSWKVRDQLRREYRDVPKVNFSDKEEHVSGPNLSDYLLLRILQISEEHDCLLIEIEKQNAEKAKKEKLEAQEREAEERLRLFSKALYVMDEHSSKKISALVEAAIVEQWTWPKDFVLDLYKVSWCTGAYRNDEYEETEFDYDSGWSLSDVQVSEPKYFVLLPECGCPARTIKTASPLTVERFRFTESTLPDRLFDLPEKIELERISIKFAVDRETYRFRLLPEFAVPSPEGCNVSVGKVTESFELKRLPCTEIRRAIDRAITLSDSSRMSPVDRPF